ncbi:MAG TPA: hypothetical protein VN083_10010 [Vicinamibacteria bacterium]|jgi:hypothetical protein|nr:hypothetical protein [Vicinamibacteria bacterium]
MAALRKGAAFLLAVGLLGLGGAPSPDGRPDTAFLDGKHRGVCYAHAVGFLKDGGYGSPASEKSLEALRALGVKWISVTPFGFQREANASTFRWGGTDETDARLRAVTAQAHALGMRVMMKPHLWLRPPSWPGSIEPRSEEGWAEWFETYERFAVHYAGVAADSHVDALCIGNELSKTTAHEKEWRGIIASVRRAYAGPLTYGAEMEEVFSVPFWDALDFIGVSGYYPLVEARSPDRSSLVAAWGPILARLSQLANRWRRKIVFTEAGYRSADFAAWKHWQVPGNATVNLRLQADAYEAFFQAVWPQPWFGGAYFWKWFSYPGHSGPDSNEWEIENKPAEAVLSRHYHDH